MTFSYRLSKDIVTDAVSTIADLNALTDQASIEAFFGGNQYGGYPVDAAFVTDIKGFYQGIVDDAALGLPMGKARYYNIPQIKPYPGVSPYLKPVFVMTDEWSISCGDIFPTIMQDIGRGQVIGHQTPGAGAFVGNWIKIPNTLGFTNFHVPIAIGYRINGGVVENIGTTPDFPLDPSVSDLNGGNFTDYREVLYKTIQSQL